VELSRLFAEIERSDFAGAVNVASGMRVAVKVALHHPLVKGVTAALPPRGGAETILARVLEVAGRGVDPRFENPYDAALMSYLLLLEEMNPALARVGAAEVMLLPNTWWAGKVAARIAVGRAHNDAGTARIQGWAINTAVADGTAYIRASTMLRNSEALLWKAFGSRGSYGTVSSEIRLTGRNAALISSRAVGSGAQAA